MHERGEVEGESIAVISLDRGEDRVYQPEIHIDVVPTLTTANRYLAVLSIQDVVDDTPDQGRLFFRKLCLCERLALQGFDPGLLVHLGDLALKATGNAYPPVFIMAVLRPMLERCKATLDLSTWPRGPLGGPVRADVPLRAIMAELQRKPPLQRQTPPAKPKSSRRRRSPSQ